MMPSYTQKRYMLFAAFMCLSFNWDGSLYSAEIPDFLQSAKLGKKVDLLGTINPSEDSRADSWTKTDDGVVSNRSGTTLLTVPGQLPERYVVYATIQRVEKNDSLGIGFRVGDSGTILMLNSAGGKSSGFYYLDDLKPGSEQNETRTTQNMISDRKSSELVLAVLENRVIVTIDGKPHIDWSGAPARLSVKNWNGIKNTDRLTLSTYYSSWKISKLELQPILKIGKQPDLAEAKRRPKPTEEQLESATKSLQDKLGYSLRAVGSIEKQSLAKKLFNELLTEDDPLHRYVLLTQSAESYAGAGDREKAWEAIEMLAIEFEVDEIERKLEGLKTVAGLRTPAPSFYNLALDCFSLTELALQEHDYDRARELLKDCIAFAKRSPSRSVVVQLQQIDDQWRSWERAYEDVREQHERAVKDRSDKSANAAWGRFLCLQRKRWEQGLPFLARGDGPLAPLAQREIKIKLDFDSALQLMSEWSDVAEDFPKDEEAAIRDHAFDVGQQAFQYADERQATLLEERIAQRFGRTRLWKTAEGETGVELGHPRANIGTEGTVELWLRTFDSSGCVIKKRLEAGESTIGLRIQKGTVAYYAQGFNYARFLYSTKRVDDGLWHHLALVKQGPYLTLFIDGEREPEVNEIRPELKSKASWHLGYSRVDSRLPLEASYARIRVSGAARYHVPFTPETQYGPDRVTLLLE